MKQNNEKNGLAYYNGAIVEVLENRGTNTVIKRKPRKCPDAEPTAHRGEKNTPPGVAGRRLPRLS